MRQLTKNSSSAAPLMMGPDGVIYAISVRAPATPVSAAPTSLPASDMPDGVENSAWPGGAGTAGAAGRPGRPVVSWCYSYSAATEPANPATRPAGRPGRPVYCCYSY
jgi:hypothetical protein